ncbi:CTP synthase [Bifidobacterium sp. 64T4]|uniref:CTP synthase n=1 Tax=Bifidobacterium pongonis TaxID=2834432 RepID=UPI001C56F0CB|nr:CTP synthase [Bifidobacterium pongonis]MBW3095514.1 CTP synthase [Bifidobacterium pongonis]
MSTKQELPILISHAEQRGCCIFGTTPTMQRALLRQAQNGSMIRLSCNVYAPRTHWETLDPAQQYRHLTITMSMRYPKRIFAGLTAAALYGLEIPWDLLRRKEIQIASTMHGFRRGTLVGVYMRSIPEQQLDLEVPASPSSHHEQCGLYPSTRIFCEKTMSCTTLRATSPARTIVDCGLQYSFREMLPVIDSALRSEIVTADEILAQCDALPYDCSPVLKLLDYADPLSENGGESLLRAVLIEYGLVPPELQRVFVDPLDSANTARTDCLWETEDGRIIVLEYDGMRKFVDPEMTGRRDIAAVVSAQIERDGLLKRAGVDAVVHATYDDIVEPKRLLTELLELGVPRVSNPMRFLPD